MHKTGDIHIDCIEPEIFNSSSKTNNSVQKLN